MSDLIIASANRFLGNWYIRCPNGGRTIGFKFSTARRLVRIYGGRVYHETWWLFREKRKLS